MDAVRLERWRLACGVLFLVLGIVGGGNYVGWWRIDGTSIASTPELQRAIKLFVEAWFVWLFLLWGAIMLINERLPEANKKAAAERAVRKEQERQQQADAARERYEKQRVAKERALAIARADYPQHLDFDALGERGWWDDEYGSEMIADHLDPPEIVLKYEIPGGNDDDEIRLYARERVAAAEANEEVKEHISDILDERKRAAEAKRQEEEQARLDAEEATAEEEEKREHERRLAQQKIIRIDHRLK